MKHFLMTMLLGLTLSSRTAEAEFLPGAGGTGYTIYDINQGGETWGKLVTIGGSNTEIQGIPFTANKTYWLNSTTCSWLPQSGVTNFTIQASSGLPDACASPPSPGPLVQDNSPFPEEIKEVPTSEVTGNGTWYKMTISGLDIGYAFILQKNGTEEIRSIRFGLNEEGYDSPFYNQDERLLDIQGETLTFIKISSAPAPFDGVHTFDNLQ